MYAHANPTVFVDKTGESATAFGTLFGFAYGVGQGIGGIFNDNVNNFSDFSTVVLQNTIGGAEIGLSIDALVLSGGLAASISGALGSAGFEALTFTGEPKTAKEFLVEQAVAGAAGAILGPAFSKAAPYLAKLPGARALGGGISRVGGRVLGAAGRQAERLLGKEFLTFEETAASRYLKNVGNPFAKVATSKGIPIGFNDAAELEEFSSKLRGGLENAGFKDSEIIFQGSSVTGQSYGEGIPFDVGRVSDFDIAIANKQLLSKARSIGVGMRSGGIRTAPLEEKHLEILGLKRLQNELSREVGRDVNFMIYESARKAASHKPSIIIK
jgi:hypothetical protein